MTVQSLRYLDLIPFNCNYTAFIVSITGGSWPADDFVPGSFLLLRQLVEPHDPLSHVHILDDLDLLFLPHPNHLSPSYAVPMIPSP